MTPDMLPEGVTLDGGPVYVNVGSVRFVDIRTNEVSSTDPPFDWMKLDTPCPTCDGDTYVVIMRASRYEGYGPWPIRQPCPDCHLTGRTVHTITVPCPTCEGGQSNPDAPMWSHVGRCPDCYPSDGTVTLSVTVRLVPWLPTYPDAPKATGRNEPHVMSDDEGAWFLGDGWIRSVTLHGHPPSPGDYIAIIEQVSTDTEV